MFVIEEDGVVVAVANRGKEDPMLRCHPDGEREKREDQTAGDRRDREANKDRGNQRFTRWLRATIGSGRVIDVHEGGRGRGERGERGER